jgi:hypothetical protein
MSDPGPVVSTNPNMCASCAAFTGDVQDSTLIDSAIPYEFERKDKPVHVPAPETVRSASEDGRSK